MAIAIAKSKQLDPIFNPGVKQCRWCEGAPFCHAYANHAQELATKGFQLYQNLGLSTTTEEIVKFLAQAPVVAQAVKKLTAFLYAEKLAGRDVPGMKLVQGRSTRAWKNEVDAASWLDHNTEIEDIFESKLISPSKAEKAERGLKKKEAFAALITKPPGKLALVSDQDSRPAFDPKQTAQDAFKNVTEKE